MGFAKGICKPILGFHDGGKGDHLNVMLVQGCNLTCSTWSSLERNINFFSGSGNLPKYLPEKWASQQEDEE